MIITVDPADAVSLASHLKFLHGAYVGDVHTMAGLVHAHENSHADPDPLYVVPHQHEDRSGDSGDFWS